MTSRTHKLSERRCQLLRLESESEIGFLYRLLIPCCHIWILRRFWTRTCHRPKASRPTELRLLILQEDGPGLEQAFSTPSAAAMDLSPLLMHRWVCFDLQWTESRSMKGQRRNAGVTAWKKCMRTQCPLGESSFPLVSVLMATEGLGAEELASAVAAGEDSLWTRCAAAFTCARPRNSWWCCWTCIDGEGGTERDGRRSRRRLLATHIGSRLTACFFQDIRWCFWVGTVHVRQKYCRWGLGLLQLHEGIELLPRMK